MYARVCELEQLHGEHALYGKEARVNVTFWATCRHRAGKSLCCG